MIFKSYSEAADLLANKIKEEGITAPVFTYINPDAKTFALLVSPNLVDFSNLNLTSPSTLVIVDNGSTNSIEYNEFTDIIRKNYPTTKIVLAIPVIPESEKATLESVCDTLIYLHADPYFFSLSQFFPLK
ncbi:MAG: hypothetical protein UU09_C0032G0018 [Microgenomates group bacterium GW2011_GWA2_40_6]|nr:MAG: hypothetical protein UU09_C0032G0018 [Microgenomates group bacterium GW2011_GWA2_40_6]